METRCRSLLREEREKRVTVRVLRAVAAIYGGDDALETLEKTDGVRTRLETPANMKAYSGKDDEIREHAFERGKGNRQFRGDVICIDMTTLPSSARPNSNITQQQPTAAIPHASKSRATKLYVPPCALDHVLPLPCFPLTGGGFKGM